MHELLFEFWGKTIKKDQGFHPALCHMIDVGMTARVLMSNQGLNRLCTMVKTAWYGANIEALIAWLPFFVALHDIGKLSVPFQGQATNAETTYHRQRLMDFDVPFPPISDVYRRLPHTIVGAVFLKDHVATLESAMPRHLIPLLRDAVSGHHGRYPATPKVWKTTRQDMALLKESSVWHDLRVAGYRVLRDIFAPSSIPLSAIGRPHNMRVATLALTGLIVFSDWIGSESGFFPATMTPSSPHAYALTSYDLAHTALRDLGFQRDESHLPLHDVRCADLFPYCAITPRALQQVLDHLPLRDDVGPTMTVVEESAGGGKSEIGLTLARRLAAYGGEDSFFIGLPTMATGNQMFGRVYDLIQRTHGPSMRVALIHGSAHLVQHTLQQQSHIPIARESYHSPYTDIDTALHTEGDTSEPSGVTALTWFRGSKKNLLMPFGVGTVDQIELAGLNTRYYMQRLVALAGKTIIIDEVHAYDTYMTTILDHTLTWLALMGCHVILLSATLPKARHQQLAQAFLNGCGAWRDESSAPQAVAAPPDLYPLISHYHAQGHQYECASPSRSHTVTVQWIDTPAIEDQAEHVRSLVRDGGAVARICNRVDTAQDLYRALSMADDADSYTLVLLHAKLPLDERLAVEARITTLVGKATQRTASDRIILIGTQVLEQSLDYDVDVMISDLAPIDLLLQRVGRLHRHDLRGGCRGPQHGAPVLFIVSPVSDDGFHRPLIEHWQMIYAPYVLYRTWYVLGWHHEMMSKTIMLPEHYRPLIEQVYHASLPETAPDMPSAWESLFRQTWMDLQAAMTKDTQYAQQRLTPNPLQNESILSGDYLPFYADEDGSSTSWHAAKTRLGEHITVLPIYVHQGRYALDPEGKHPIPSDSRAELSLDEQHALLHRSLPISSPSWCLAQLRKQRWRWKNVPPLLKYMYPLYLHPDGRSTVNPRMQLVPTLGFCILKENI